jgi:hypothetical protein
LRGRLCVRGMLILFLRSGRHSEDEIYSSISSNSLSFHSILEMGGFKWITYMLSSIYLVSLLSLYYSIDFTHENIYPSDPHACHSYPYVVSFLHLGNLHPVFERPVLLPPTARLAMISATRDACCVMCTRSCGISRTTPIPLNLPSRSS